MGSEMCIRDSNHPVFLKAFNAQGSNFTKRNLSTFFTMSLMNKTIDNSKLTADAVKYEAEQNCIVNNWSSFLCILGLSSVINFKIRTVFPDCGSLLDKLLKNMLIEPRESEKSEKRVIYILFCQSANPGEKISEHTRDRFQSNHFSP